MPAAIVISAELGNWMVFGGTIAAFFVLAFLFYFLLGPLLSALTRRTRTTLDDFIVKGLRLPLFLALLGFGIWLALVRLPGFEDNLDTINGAFVIIAILIGTLAVAQLFSAIITWYGGEVAHRTHTDFDDKLIPIIKRVGNVAIYALAIVLIIDNRGWDVTPLVAGLGVGGLAVAVALQPTLSNFLAGTYVISDAVIRRGHYVLLDSGQEGLIEDIGWRSTKIRHWQGNLIVLPNSKLADAVVTDFEAAEPAKVFAVACGVSYASDLDRVEEIALEVARQTIKACPEAVKDYQPVVRFKEFGDSNINFTVVLKSVDRISQFPLKHEFIKALHRRFKQEGITIEYPVRKLLFTEAENQTAPSFSSRVPRSSDKKTDNIIT